MEGILGMEQPVEFSMGSLLDPTMALLLIGAYKNYADFAYRDYKDYMDQQKEFNKEYGDFFSYFSADNQQWADATRGLLQRTYDNLAKNGIDPLRSMEGRAAMQRAMNSIDPALLSRLRANADASKEYVKNVADLQSKGMYNQDFEDFASKMQQGSTFREYNTTPDGRMWTRTSPTQYKTLFDATVDRFKDMLPGFIKSDGRYNWDGITPEKVRQVAQDLVNSGWGESDIYGAYYKNDARRRAADPNSDASVNKLLVDDIVAQHEAWRTFSRRDEDQYGLLAYSSQLASRHGGGGGSHGGGGYSQSAPKPVEDPIGLRDYGVYNLVGNKNVRIQDIGRDFWSSQDVANAVYLKTGQAKDTNALFSGDFVTYGQQALLAQNFNPNVTSKWVTLEEIAHNAVGLKGTTRPNYAKVQESRKTLNAKINKGVHDVKFTGDVVTMSIKDKNGGKRVNLYTRIEYTSGDSKYPNYAWMRVTQGAPGYVGNKSLTNRRSNTDATNQIGTL